MGMERYTIYCTVDQARKAFKYGAPINEMGCSLAPMTMEIDGRGYYIPTTQQLIGWLREEKGIGTPVVARNESEYYYIITTDRLIGPFEVYKDAEHAALDISLKQLEEKDK